MQVSTARPITPINFQGRNINSIKNAGQKVVNFAAKPETKKIAKEELIKAPFTFAIGKAFGGDAISFGIAEFITNTMTTWGKLLLKDVKAGDPSFAKKVFNNPLNITDLIMRGTDKYADKLPK